ncbi:MAG: SPOR domain-containing protein [Fidelibacterota bacterium]|nr:MAG: SPOR domain-containing protein [Candidatus Neomarinimicrobiota bacterium]
MILWTNWSNYLSPVFLTLLISTPAWGQDLDYYFNLVYQGKVEEVAEALPQLYRQYPNDGTVLYLEGLITQDGDAAVELYKRLANLYPSSPYADDALLKIGEYLYARGLYVQAAQFLKRIPVHYPRSDLIYPGIRLFLNSLLVSGNRDTAHFYVQVFSRRYPEIEFDLEAGRASSGPESTPLMTGEVSAPRNKAPVEPTPTSRKSPESAVTGSLLRLQAGAFSVRENAERRKGLLESLNYRVEIVTSLSGERPLYVVIVEGFRSREDAELAGRLLKENYEIDSFILPEE